MSTVTYFVYLFSVNCSKIPSLYFENFFNPSEFIFFDGS